MSECILIALVGAIINMILALIIPSLIKDTNVPILDNIKKVYATHKQVIITSSIIVFITILLALKFTPYLGLSFENKMSLHSSNDFDNLDNLDNLFNSRPSMNHRSSMNSGIDSNRLRVINLI